jgi:chromosome partitioning protein
LLGRLGELIQDQSARLRGWQVMESAMAAAALVACPDGKVSLARRVALDRLLTSRDEFKPFGVHEAVNLFTNFAREIHARPERGRGRALRAVAGCGGDPKAACLIMEIASTLGEAEGGWSPSDVARLEELSRTLGLPAPRPGAEDLRPSATAGPCGRVIALGNVKGGTGKSTIAVHLTAGLLEQGFQVGCVDLDGGQGTLSRYLENRAATAMAESRSLAVPRHRRVKASAAKHRDTADAEETARLREAFAELADCDFIVVDTPGSESHLARLGHFNADILVTPINDSYLDIDVLARIDRRKREVLAASDYCRMVWDLRERRGGQGARQDGEALDWIVVRNRLAHIDARNSRDITLLLNQLSRRIGFRLGRGLSERVGFRELFDRGLTLLDLAADDSETRNGASHRRARQEIFDLIEDLELAEAPQHLAAAAR